MTIDIFIYRLGLAFLLGASIGLERQYRQKSAGLRTNTLVSLGSAAFILLSLSLTGDVSDPSRVAGQIVTGRLFRCWGNHERRIERTGVKYSRYDLVFSRRRHACRGRFVDTSLRYCFLYHPCSCHLTSYRSANQ